MGKGSRAKRNRVGAPVPRFSMKSFSLDRSTWIFVIGIFVLSYGTAAMQYSRIMLRMLASIPLSIHGRSSLGSH
jgi:hypothetical protein